MNCVYQASFELKLEEPELRLQSIVTLLGDVAVLEKMGAAKMPTSQ